MTVLLASPQCPRDVPTGFRIKVLTVFLRHRFNSTSRLHEVKFGRDKNFNYEPQEVLQTSANCS